MADLSKRLDTTLAAVSYAVQRGAKIAKEAGCPLDDLFIGLFQDVPEAPLVNCSSLPL